jgi:glycosidase
MAVIMDWVANHTAWDNEWISNVPFFSNSPINWSDNPDMLNAYKDIMSVYGESAVAKGGSITSYSNSNIVCFKKILDSQELLVVINMRSSTTGFQLPADLQNTSWTNSLSGSQVTLETSMQLTNYQYMILEK